MNALYRPSILIILFSVAMHGFAAVDAPIGVSWDIDVKKGAINYSIKNKTPDVIKFSPDVVVLSRHEDEIWPSTLSEKDSVLHLSVEIVMPKSVPCETAYSHIGAASQPVEIKPNETKSFSYSLSKTFPFSSRPETVKQIGYAQCKVTLDDKIVYKAKLKYENGNWELF